MLKISVMKCTREIPVQICVLDFGNFDENMWFDGSSL